MLIANISPRTSGKTTSTGWQTHALHERRWEDHGLTPRTVKAFDADYSRQLQEWDAQVEGGFPFPVIGAASPAFHKNIPPMLGPDEVGVVDCGHAEEHGAIVRSVLRVADIAILNSAPTQADVDRIERLPMRQLIDEITVLRADGEPVPTWVLLNRCNSHSPQTTNAFKDYFRDAGWNVFDTVIPFQLQYSGSVLEPVTAKGSAYDALITEMITKGMFR